VSEGPLDKLGSKALAVEQARLARFFQTINKHRKALDIAIDENFAGRLDPAEWKESVSV
jgi:cyanophycinase-like exopeptidase